MPVRPLSITLITRITAALCATVLSVQTALACACCAEVGDRQSQDYTLDDLDLEGLNALQGDGQGGLYSTACGDECIQGLDWFDDGWPYQPFDLEIQMSGGAFAMTIQNGLPAQTDLRATLPDIAHIFAVHQTPVFGQSMVDLYVEHRFEMTLAGSGGGWAGGPDPVNAELVLMGEGNACRDVTNARHWVLSVGGSDQAVDFRLFGAFKGP